MSDDFDQLIHDIVYGNTDQRAIAAVALGELKDQQAVEPLLELLKDPYSIVRCAAIHSLGKLHDRQVIEPLLNILGHPDEHTQIAVVKALGELGDPRAIQPLRSLLSQTSEFNPLTGDITRTLTQLGAPASEISSKPKQEAKRSSARNLFYLGIALILILFLGMIVLIFLSL